MRTTTVALLLMMGCSTSTTNPDDAGLVPDGAALFDDGALADADAAEPACEPDFLEPDDSVSRTTFDAYREGGPVAYSETWEGTWASDGFDDVDRIRLNVPGELAQVVPDQVWRADATNAREVQLVITCDPVEGVSFTGCAGGTQPEHNVCVMTGVDSVMATGHCGRGGALLELTATQAGDAPCMRSLRVEIVH